MSHHQGLFQIASAQGADIACTSCHHRALEEGEHGYSSGPSIGVNLHLSGSLQHLCVHVWGGMWMCVTTGMQYDLQWQNPARYTKSRNKAKAEE